VEPARQDPPKPVIDKPVIDKPGDRQAGYRQTGYHNQSLTNGVRQAEAQDRTAGTGCADAEGHRPGIAAMNAEAMLQAERKRLRNPSPAN
jgi:hypothetical protein